MSPKKSPYFTVIIPCKNEEALIQQCLSSIVNQSTKKSYEIIVVDGNSTDKTLEIAKGFSVKIIKDSLPGKCNGLQTAIKYAKGEILCFTEADCKIPSNWLERINNDFISHKKSIAVVGLITFYNSTFFYKSLAKIFLPICMYIFKIFFRTYPFRTSNFAVYRQSMEKVGGFNTNTKELYDVDLSFRIKNLGRIVFDSDLIVETSDRRIKNRLFTFLSEVSRSLFYVAILRKPVPQPLYQDIR